MRNLLLALAVFRLTKLVVEDRISEPFRDAVQTWAGEAPDGSFKDQVSYLVECRACVSIWTAGVVLGLSYLGRPGMLVVKTLAGSGAALVIAGLVDRLERS